MRIEHLDEMINGWFVGNFKPTLYSTNECEVAIKRYAKGAVESAHYHKIATEITVVVSGKVKMCDQILSEGDMIVLSPGEVSSFESLEDSVNVVVKIPGANNDKYLMEDGLC